MTYGDKDQGLIGFKMEIEIQASFMLRPRLDKERIS